MTTRTLGLIGSGMIGSAPARLAVAVGLDVVLSNSRGTLADSWRSEPDTPVYVQPYMAERPEGLSQEETGRWFFETPGVPVSAARVKELAGSAVRRPHTEERRA